MRSRQPRLGRLRAQARSCRPTENCRSTPTGEDFDGDVLACTGEDLWHKGFGDAGAQTALDVAAWNGGAVLCGFFAGTVNFGGVGLVSGGGNDAFVASYDYLGAHMWSKRFGDRRGPIHRPAVAVDLDGSVIVAGDNSGKIDPGGGQLATAGLADVFLAKFDVFGTFLWAKEFGDNKAQNVFSVATDSQGRIAVAGQYAGKIDFGGGLMTSAGGTDAFVAVFDKTGTHLWSKTFGDAVAQAGKSVAFGPMGEVILAGDNAGVIDLGNGPHTTAGGTDVFLASFDANGAPLWSKELGDASTQVAKSVATDSVGSIVLLASHRGQDRLRRRPAHDLGRQRHRPREVHDRRHGAPGPSDSARPASTTRAASPSTRSARSPSPATSPTRSISAAARSSAQAARTSSSRASTPSARPSGATARATRERR